MPLLTTLALAGGPDPAPVAEVLDRLHRAAAQADAEGYWDCYAADAVFIGTDPSERWSLDAFRAFAAPHFEQAPAWAYTPASREIHFGPGQQTAWFYEELDHERYGRVRGSGALVRQRGAWKVAQYVLSFPIPNQDAPEVLALLEVSDRRLPTPFTGAAIRAAYLPGRRAVWRIFDGERWTRRLSEVVGADADGVTLRAGAVDDLGAPLAEPQTYTAPWTELRDHAAFPVGRTTWRDEVPVSVPAGTFTTRRYTVRGASPGAERTFWFDLGQPGPPVKMEVRVDGELTEAMELVQVEPGTRATEP